MTQRAIWTYEGTANMATVPRAVQVGSIDAIEQQGLYFFGKAYLDNTRCLPSGSIAVASMFTRHTYQERR